MVIRYEVYLELYSGVAFSSGSILAQGETPISLTSSPKYYYSFKLSTYQLHLIYYTVFEI